MNNSFVIKGNICQTMNPKELDLHENAYAVCVDGVSKGVFDALPEEYASLPLYDYGDALIFPGMVDLHVHAPQYAFRGMCMDLELMDWLNQYTFPEGYEFDAVVMDDSVLPHPQSLNLAERMERAVYLGLDEKITAKYVAGKMIVT